MAGKDKNGELIKDGFAGFEFIGRQRRVRRGGKGALKVQLCHAMDEIIIDMKQALELNAREATVVPAIE